MSERAWRIEPLAAEHTRGLAECHIACWREAYRELVPRHVLDAFDVDRRAEQWERVRVRYPGSTVVALAGETVVGFASGGPSRDEPPAADRELNALYVRAAWYGSGVAHDLMRAVLQPGTGTSLWVFQDNPRAQAFYRKYGFELDGTRRVEAFTPALEVRMIRRSDPDRPS
ncbi:2-(1,2-epoxy-1,2-dihydrophenyl)acetyl-CoA isomerase [Nocardia transvalensis]|uniref:2-(1,2-epoxy-1,2-dihydrophenyl)acetyl-CoA isomerase n=1 Tax=Nocardia transvalensis TaxID=37333 RepID=A0A7W9P9H5_9NOCA|nr:GNAT family N-acetyltransferase [Nocardia transvalensis]MBB5911663.1 2-(1,2-epoxy-1,2-dihydrophenyl)acetyl-CoA isomerase [Nocardia transvalensis]